MKSNQRPGKSKLWELARLFLKLGLIGFGGPAVHISMMEEEVVRKRKWMSNQHFLDLVGATNLIPGPNSTEMTMHCGHERAGIKGLIIAGSCFIIPAVIITGIIAWFYQEYGQLPSVHPFIYGIKPAIISVIIVAMIQLGKKALKSFELGIIGFISSIAVLIGANEILILFGAGIIGVILHFLKQSNRQVKIVVPILLWQLVEPVTKAGDLKIFWIFLKIGSILYGSGYILFAFLDAELVTKGLLSKQQLIDAIAVGQFTPGPVFSSATFIGWQMGGIYGAIAATIGIFLPSFLFVAFLNPLIPKLRRSAVMTAFLDTINMVSVAIIISVAIEMAADTLLDWRTIAIAVISFLVNLGYRKLNTAFMVIGGAALGYLLSLFPA